MLFAARWTTVNPFTAYDVNFEMVSDIAIVEAA